MVRKRRGSGSRKQKGARRRKSQEGIEREGMRIADAAGGVVRVRKDEWLVLSEPDGAMQYNVRYDGEDLRCECPYYVKHEARCKHAAAVQIAIIRSHGASGGGGSGGGGGGGGGGAGAGVRVEAPGVRCTRCGSEEWVRNGHRKNRGSGRMQRHRCKKCGRRFVFRPGFEGRRAGAATITFAIFLYSLGVSPANVAEALAYTGVRVHGCTIQRWAEHYSSLVKGYAEEVLPPPPRLGPRWSADEKGKKIRGLQRWIFVVMDASTRFILSTDVSAIKQGYDSEGLLREAVRRAGGLRPALFITDGLQSFVGAFKRVMRSGRGGPASYHLRDIHLRDIFRNNNAHERMNGELGDRLKTSRGLQREDSALIRIVILHHNFARRHAGLGGITPAEAAGIHIRGDDKWMPLIMNAALCARQSVSAPATAATA